MMECVEFCNNTQGNCNVFLWPVENFSSFHIATPYILHGKSNNRIVFIGKDHSSYGDHKQKMVTLDRIKQMFDHRARSNIS